MGVVCGIVEREEEAEDLGYRPSSAPKQACDLGNVLKLLGSQHSLL